MEEKKSGAGSGEDHEPSRRMTRSKKGHPKRSESCWGGKGHSLVDGLAELLQAHVVGVQEVQLGRVPGRQLRLDFLPHSMLR